MWSNLVHNFWTLKVPFTYTSPNSWLFLPRVLILFFIYVPNFILLVVVCITPSLRYPRNIFWCAVCCSDLIVACFFTTEIALSMTRSTSEIWCVLIVMHYSTPYCLLLNNVVIASWDREMAIRHPIWHRRKMTNTRVILIILVSNILAFLLSLAPYWTKLVPATCEFYLFNVELTCCFYLVMICICIVLHVKVLVAARRAIRSPHFRPSYRRSVQPPYFPSIGLLHNRGTTYDVGGYPRSSYPESVPQFALSLAVAEETSGRRFSQNLYQDGKLPESPSRLCTPVYNPVSRLEIKAAVTITLGLIPLWLFSLPMVVTTFMLAICIQWGESDCAETHFAYLFVREVYLLHGIYNPLVYMYRSPDFRFALRRIVKRTFPSF